MRGLHYSVEWNDSKGGERMVFEFECVGEPHLVLERRTNVQYFERMINPCVMTYRFEVDECFGPNWSHCCCIKRLHAFHRIKLMEARV